MNLFKIFPSVFIVPLCIAPSLQATESNDVLLRNLSLESLGQIQVYTADRQLGALNKTSSVVTVITAQQIKEQGLQTLAEVLERIPGMFLDFRTSIQPFVYHRGFKQDQNTGILLLINGVSQNSKIAYGFDFEHTFPHLYNIKQIEIVRGSNSTLWGSDAATAVVNIITHTGSSIDRQENEYGTFTTAYNHKVKAKEHRLDLLWGKSFDDGDMMMSYTYSQSEAELVPTLRKGVFRNYAGWDSYSPSHNIYLNSSYMDFTLDARYATLAIPEPNSLNGPASEPAVTDPSKALGDRKRTFASINVKNNTKINNKLNVETQVGYGSIVGNDYRNDLKKEVDIYSESHEYIESILHYKTQNWQSLVGTKITINHLELSNETIKEKAGVETEYVKAVFFNTTYRGIKDLKIIAGVRASQSDLRSEGVEVMPKFSAIYSITDNWNTLYSYSTGFIHPLRVYNQGDDWWLATTFDSDNDGVDDTRRYQNGTKLPQEVETNELQVKYTDNKLSIASTLFYVNIKNQFDWAAFDYYLPDETATDGFTQQYRVVYANNKLTNSYGLELDFNYRYSSFLETYANVTYQDSEHASAVLTSNHDYDVNDRFEVGEEVSRVPDTMYNLGINLALFNTSTLNIHYRGYKGSILDEKKYGTQHFVDMSYRYRDLFKKNLNLSIYGKNIFDNTELTNHGIFGMTESGADIGLTLEYIF